MGFLLGRAVLISLHAYEQRGEARRALLPTRREAVGFSWCWHPLERSQCHQRVRRSKKPWKTQGQHPGCFHEQSLLLCTTRKPANAPRLCLSKPKFAPRALTWGWHPNSRAGRAQEGGIFLLSSQGRVGRMLSLPVSAWSPQCFLFCSG